MARCLSLPYQPSNPRTVPGAKKRGWHVIKANKVKWKQNLSWLGLCIWTEKSCMGYWVASWHNSEFAFENAADATAFTLKWS